MIFIFATFWNAGFVNANVLYSQLDDSVQLSGNNFSGNNRNFTDATGSPVEVRISYNDSGNGPGHFILVGIVDVDAGITYYGYNPSVSSSCGNTFESKKLNTKQILTFDTNWEWRAYPCTGANLVFNPTHRYHLQSSRNAGGINTQVYYGSSSDPNNHYGYIENSTNFHDSQKSIISFGFPNLAEGVVDEANRTISVHVPFGTDISALTPVIQISDGASVNPNSIVVQNFNNTVVYTVTAVDGSTRKYSVKILFDCNVGCATNVLYDQSDNSTEISTNISSFPLLTGASGRISNLKFSYNDHGEKAGHFVGVSIYDYTKSIQYYSSLNGRCGDAYESTGKNEKIIVTLDSSMTYKEYPCTGPNLELDPTHTYGVSLFRNRGGLGLQKFYGSGIGNKNVYLHVESQSETSQPVCTVDCFSNVLFLPGVMGSRLYEQDGTEDNELWLSSFASDHVRLGLNDQGKSINDLYTKNDTQNEDGENETGLIDEIYGANIYNSFIDNLREWKEDDQIIADYAFIPYDWRLSLEDIITNGTITTEGNLSYGDPQDFSESFILKKLEELQSSSKSGKVTIVGHSNGGLVAKAFVQKLQDTNNPLYDQIDKIIFVGVPQVGTPDAMINLLHGSELGSGFIMDEDRSRQLSENMPAIYNLLPSISYFTTVDPGFVIDQIASFEDTSFFDPQTSQYGFYVSNETELRNYILGTDGRSKPSFSDTEHPNIGNSFLYSQAEAMHQILDHWQPSSNTKVIQVAGWGEETIAGIDYETRSSFLGSEHLSYKPRFVIDGDGTVVTPSALWMSNSNPNVERWWVNLATYNEDNSPDRIHRSILEVSNLTNFIESKIKDELTFSDSDNIVVGDDSTLISDGDRLHYTLHSPLTLGIEVGDKYTGQDPVTGEIREEIPGVTYRRIGDVQFISAPADIAYTLKLQGYEEGHFSLDVDKQEGNTITEFTSFQGIPSSISTEVSMDIVSNQDISDTILAINTNGDEIIDFNLNAKLGGVVTMPKPLTVTADKKVITLGNPILPLTATLSGFDDAITNDVTGIANCTTTATNTSPVGTYPITCTVGSLSSSNYYFEEFISSTLTINYRFDGFLQPINDTAHQVGQEKSVFKAGSTIPVKLQLKKSDGTVIQAITPPIWLAPVKGSSMSASIDESVYSLPATTGTDFKWDSISQQYIYNWSTKGFSSGNWYKIFVKLDDGNTYSVTVGLK